MEADAAGRPNTYRIEGSDPQGFQGSRRGARTAVDSPTKHLQQLTISLAASIDVVDELQLSF